MTHDKEFRNKLKLWKCILVVKCLSLKTPEPQVQIQFTNEQRQPAGLRSGPNDGP